MKRVSIALCAAALAAAPAAALDAANGVYTGKAACRQIVAGVASKSKHDAVLNVAQDGAGITMSGSGSDGFTLGTTEALLAEDAAKAERGSFAGLGCSPGAVHGDLVIKSNGKASMKATLISLDEEGSVVRFCTFAGKRTAISSPPSIPCVPLP